MTADESIDSSEIQSALGSIGLSAALVFGATLLSQGLGFLTRVTMALSGRRSPRWFEASTTA